MVQLYMAAWVVQVIIMIGAPIAVAVWFARRYGVGLAPFLFGAGIFLVFQMLTRIPGVQMLSAALAPRLEGNTSLQLVYVAFLAVTAGLFESVGRWLGYRFLFRRRIAYEWRNGVAYGIGHAGIESVVMIGLTQAINLVVTVVVLLVGSERLAGVLPEALMAQLGNIPEQISRLAWHLPLWGGLERVLTIPFHVAMSLIVLQAFTRGRGYWLWVAVGVHALMDFTAPALLQFAHWPIWAVELYIAVWSAAALLLIVWLKPPSKEAAAVS